MCLHVRYRIITFSRRTKINPDLIYSERVFLCVLFERRIPDKTVELASMRAFPQNRRRSPGVSQSDPQLRTAPV